MTELSRNSVLLVTLDSCRFDTFENSVTPNLDRVGPMHRAMAPSYFTFASHAAIFAGFTPGVAAARESFVNPKYGKIFKLGGAAFPGRGRAHIALEGHNIIDGFRRKGFLTLGTGAVGWFDPATQPGRLLTQDFERYFYPGNTWSNARQVDWLLGQIDDSPPGQPVFAFINVGETHVPYYHEGASWDRAHNPCVPFADKNDAMECRRRQKACLEHCDRTLEPLLSRFREATVVICGDHGDAWGEDDLWEHGIHHPAVLEVPLLFRLVTA